MDLYHTQLGFPKWFVAPKSVVKPQYGDHSRFEAQTDRYGKITLPNIIDLSKFKVIEIGVVNGKCVKVLVRGALDAKRDICIVLTNTGYVKTVWVNLNTDTHKTLDKSKYCHG